jgi:hypothetical protein
MIVNSDERHVSSYPVCTLRSASVSILLILRAKLPAAKKNEHYLYLKIAVL